MTGPWPMRARTCFRQALPAAWRTARWLIAITVPVSGAVFLLKAAGLLPLAARLTAPAFAALGMPAESALVFLTAGVLNLYSAIAVIETLGLAGRPVTILALMCLISHNLPVELAVQKRAGGSVRRLLALRLGASFAGAWLLNRLLPPEAAPAPAAVTAGAAAAAEFGAEFAAWAAGMARLCVLILALVTALMVLERLLDEFGVTRVLARALGAPLRLLGIPADAGFLWIVANTLGLGYGAGILIDHIDRGKLSRPDATLLNTHIAVSHSLLEDTLLFVAIGVPAAWITLPRLALASLAAWLVRLARRIRQPARPIPAGG